MEAQRTLEWYRKRLGCFTGSRIGDLMKTNRSGNGVGECAMNYIYQVAGERMLNPAMINDDGFFSDYITQTANAMGNGERARCPAHIRT